MQKQIFIFLFFLAAIAANSQNIRVDGYITDAAKTGLEMANVMAVNADNGAMEAYAITNDKGRFLLNLKANSTYSIKVSYLGMKNKEVSLRTSTESITQNIILEEGGIELDGVEIVREMPVSISGDTIIYNADSFKTGTERKLEDVLKKLPGVQVNADGEVEVEGKRVTKLMVEGKDFFDGDTKLGVKNIPADAIDKIQVLRNYNEVSALKGLENNEESVAMNIKLKEGKKNFWFGDMSAGIGIGHEESRYIANPKLFYYNPKFSVGILSNFNNIGELPLTVQDYFKFSGGFKNMMRKGGTNFNVASNDLGISLMRNNRAKEIETQFGATNFSYNVSKSWSLSGFGILSSSTTEMETESTTEILNTGVVEERKDVSLQNSNLGLFKLSSSYKPNTKLQFIYDVLMKRSGQDENNALVRNVTAGGIENSENIWTTKEQNPLSVNQNLSLYYTAGDKNVIAFEMQHLYQNEDPFYNANLQSQPFDFISYDGVQNRNNINQQRFVRTNKIDLKLDYYYMLTPKSNINVTLGNTYSHQNFDSNIYQILDNDGTNNLDTSQNRNDVRYTFDDAFVGLHYKFITGKFTFNPGFSVHNYSMLDDQNNSENKKSFVKILPDVYALYQIKKSEALTYNFSLNNDFTDINQLAEGYVFSNYNTLFRGNRNLENATSQVHSLRYFKYNMFNFENIFAFANYSRRVDAIKTAAVFEGINQTSSPYQSNFADENLSANGQYGRSFLKNFKASASVGINWAKYNNIQNGEQISSESFTQNYTLKGSTNFKNMPNLELGYNLVINEYSNSTFYTQRPFAKLDYYFLDSFSLVTEYEFYHYTSQDKTVDNNYDFLTASLIYKKPSSQWEFKISGTNLLNTTSLNDDSFTQFASRTSQYRVQPRYLIFGVSYNL